MVKKISFFIFFGVFNFQNIFSQFVVGASSIDNAAQFEVVSSDKGVLLPRVQLTGTNDVTTISNVSIGAKEGLLVYNTVTVNDVIPGYYYWDKNKWVPLIGTDNQNLILSGNNIGIEGGNTVSLSSLDTDDQTLSISGNNLNISEGNSVSLSGINTDDQNLSLSGNNLSIEGGNSVSLASLDTDNQTLSLLGTNLAIQDGNTISLNGLLDDLGNHTATTTLQMSKQKIANVGHIEFAAGGGAREGYIGNDNNNMQYVAEQGAHLFQGGNVGVGIAPSFKLHVNGRTKLDGADAGTWIESGANDWFLGREGANFRLWNNGNKFNLTPSGNLWNSGTTTIGNLATVSGSTYATVTENDGTLRKQSWQSVKDWIVGEVPSSADNLGNHNATTRLWMNGNEIQGAGSNTLINGVEVGQVGHGGSWLGLANKNQATKSGYALIQNNVGQTLLNTQSGQKIGFRVANTEKMTMTSSGNFGVGVISPSAKLDVNGNVRIRSIAGGTTSDQVVTVDANGNVRKVAMSTVGGQGNTDNQSLSLSGTTLSINRGNAVNLNSLKDNLGNHIATTTLQMSKQKIANVGHIEFASGSGAREGYIGNDNNNMQYVAEQGSHLFRGGNVGIGISPSFKLHISDRMKMDGPNAGTWIEAGANDWFLGRNSSDLRIYNNGDRVTFKPNGNVGIGTSNPSSKLTVAGNVRFISNRPSLFFDRQGGAAWHMYVTNGEGDIDQNDFIIRKSGVSGNPYMVINDKTGNVGFGVENTQGHKIRALGSIRGTRFVSDTKSYPDYVFDHYYDGSSELNEKYTFPSLEEVEEYTRQNGHLPGVSSIKDIKREGGLDIARLGVQNLEKIEELYLHIIELNKIINSLKKENEELSDKLNSEIIQMNGRIDQLSTLVKKSSKL